MKRTAIFITTLALAGTGHAAIAPGASGNGELFLNVFDTVAKVSYALDLGVTMDAFFISAQQDIGMQRFWAVDTPIWSTFQTLTTAANLQWSVVAIDSTGPTSSGQQRLFTTVRQGDEAKAGTMTNVKLSDGIGAAQGGTFFGTVNSVALATAGKSTHVVADPTDHAINGNSYSLSTDSGNAYYGKSGALTATYNGNAPFSAANAVGKSSWFYYLTRSGSSSGASVLVDEFDNLGHDGFFGFVKVEDHDNSSPFYDPTSPYAGKYLLSFTMPVFDVRTTAAFQSFALGIGRTEFSGGLQVSALDGAAAAAATEQAAGWVTVLGAAPDAQQGFARLGMASVSSVPEPGSWALMLAGAAWLASRGRRATRPA